MGKYKRNFKWKKRDRIIKWFVLLFTITVTMSIGYAVLNDTLQINGTANILPQIISGSYTIVYNANGGTGTMNPQTINIGDTVTLTPNAFTNASYPFSHWNTSADGSGTDYYDAQSVKDLASDGQTITLYAQWAFDVARIGNTYYPSLQAALNAVPNNTETTVELLKNVSENLVVAVNKNVNLDLKGHTNSITNGCILTNNGTVKMTNGTLTSNSTSDGAINNNSTGTLIISGGKVLMTNTGGKQAIYNDKGSLTITGSAYISSESRLPSRNARGAVQNQAGGTLNITGGTIVSPAYIAVDNRGDMTIGNKDGTSDNNSPVIQGGTYGIDASKDFNFYDGIIKGKTAAISNEARIVDIESSHYIKRSTEVISGDTYNVIYLVDTPNNHTVMFNANGGTVNEITRSVPPGTAVGTLPIPNNRAGYDFVGWFTLAEGGDEISASTIINNDVTFYAHWNRYVVATVDGVDYYSLQEAINAVPQTNVAKTVTLVHNTTEYVETKANQKIVLDIGSYTINNDGNQSVIENFADLEIISGTITSNADTGTLNNRAGGILKISGQANIIATGTRQAVYNYKDGYIEISGNCYLSSTTTGYPPTTQTQLERGTVQNLAGGTVVITGGTIECSTQSAIANNGTVTVGVKDGSINQSSPSISGNTNGILNAGTVNYYDGTTRGVTTSINGTVGDIETNSQFIDSTEVINGKTYNTKHLEVAQP